jgi:hypothetical protein
MLFSFSLPTEQYLELLEKYHDSTLPPDSPNLFIKSIVLKALGPKKITPDIHNRLNEIEEALGDLKDRVEEAEGLDPDTLQRLANVLITDIKAGLDYGDRLSALEGRLSALEGDKPETAIMIQKRHSPAPVIPEITYSHEQAATEWQRTTATVKRWASKPEKWPQGWIYDSDREYWTLA